MQKTCSMCPSSDIAQFGLPSILMQIHSELRTLEKDNCVVSAKLENGPESSTGGPPPLTGPRLFFVAFTLGAGPYPQRLPSPGPDSCLLNRTVRGSWPPPALQAHYAFLLPLPGI